MFSGEAGPDRSGIRVLNGLSHGDLYVLKVFLEKSELVEEVHIGGCDTLEVHLLYGAMDVLAENGEIRKEVCFEFSDLCKVDVDLIFYNTKSVHFEIDDQDPTGERAWPASGAIRRTGGGMPRRQWSVWR